MSKFNCPISLDEMRLPVITNTGHTYDFVSIAEYFLETGCFLDPLTRHPITRLTINQIIRDNTKTITESDCLKIAFLSVALGCQRSELVLTTIIALPNIALYIQKIKSYQLISYMMQSNKSAILVELILSNSYIKHYYINQTTSPLDQAVRARDLALVRCCLDIGLDPNKKNEQNESPLLLAAKFGYIEIVDYLISNPTTDVNMTDVKGDTPFNVATQSGYLDCMQSLRRREDLNINYVNARGITPVWLAVFIGRKDILAFLLSIPDIKINQATMLGTTPYKLAEKQRRVEFATMIKSSMFSQKCTENPDMSSSDPALISWTPC